MAKVVAGGADPGMPVPDGHNSKIRRQNMEAALKTKKNKVVTALRLLARIWSILSIGLAIMFILGEGMGPFFNMRDWVLFLFFLGTYAGMIVAWRWEGLGGLITVGSLAAFYLTHRLFSPGFPRGFWFFAFAAPGFLFLLCWLWTKWVTRRAFGSIII